MRTLLFLMIALLCQASWSAGMQLSFRAPKTELTSESTLNDVLLIRDNGSNNANIVDMKSLPVFEYFKGSKVIRRKDVDEVLTKVFPEVGNTYSWRGSSSTIAIQISFIKPEHLTALAREFLVNKIASRHPYAKLQIQPMSRLNVRVYGQVSKLAVSGHSKKCMVKEKACIDFELLTDTGFRQQLRQWYRIDLYAEGLVSRSDFKAGRILRDEDFVIRRVPILKYCPADTIKSSESLAGFRLRSSLNEGQLICNHHLETVPLVRVNGRVQVEFTAGAISIVAVGTALDDGELNEIVSVRIKHSKTLLHAIVIGNERVKVYGT